jgi:hypothetical protein
VTKDDDKLMAELAKVLRAKKPTCDHCPWVITSLTAYVNHLEKQHPEGGDARPRG